MLTAGFPWGWGRRHVLNVDNTCVCVGLYAMSHHIMTIYVQFNLIEKIVIYNELS